MAYPLHPQVDCLAGAGSVFSAGRRGRRTQAPFRTVAPNQAIATSMVRAFSTAIIISPFTGDIKTQDGEIRVPVLTGRIGS